MLIEGLAVCKEEAQFDRTSPQTVEDCAQYLGCDHPKTLAVTALLGYVMASLGR